MEITGISLTEADGQVFLRGTPNPQRAPVDITALHTLLAEAGYGNCVLLDEVIAKAAEDCSTRTTPFVVQIAEKRDAEIQVTLTDDRMQALIRMLPPRGGKPAQADDLLRALSEAAVIFGLDNLALLNICSQGNCEPTLVARGLTPLDGRDAQFEELVPQTANRAPRVDANGFIDYREHGAITLVEPGAPLMRRIPATAGVDGYNVLGQLLEPRPGRDEPFAATLAGAEVDATDPNMLKAAITGQPVRVPCGVQVEPVLRVANVNLATGNIYFDGCVQVDGEVIQGMKVQASGDIIVGGTVDGGLLEAAGNIVVAGGIIAQAQVRAGGSVSARFAEASSIHAGITIDLNDMALECELHSLNQIVVGAKAPQRGKLVGGKATAMMLISTPLLGSDRSARTLLTVGANPELEQQFQALQERLNKEKANEENLQKLVQHLTKAGDPKGMLERVRTSWRQALQVWGNLLAERTELEKQLALTRNARVDVGVGTSGSVEMHFGSRKLRLAKDFSRGAFSVDNNSRLVFTDPQGQATPLG